MMHKITNISVLEECSHVLYCCIWTCSCSFMLVIHVDMLKESAWWVLWMNVILVSIKH